MLKDFGRWELTHLHKFNIFDKGNRKDLKKPRFPSVDQETAVPIRAEIFEYLIYIPDRTKVMLSFELSQALLD